MISIKKISLFLLLWGIILPLAAQETEPPVALTYQSSLVGIGRAKVYDSYLSPLSYSGTHIGFLFEQMKQTGLCEKKIFAQHQLNATFADAKNPAGTAEDYAGALTYNYGLYYRFPEIKRFQFFAGGQIGGLFGMLYNSRNGNNPVDVKADFSFNLSGIAAYRMQIKQQLVNLRYQINVLVAGGLLSPEYGQSYYEIGLGEGGSYAYFASLHNRIAINQLLSVEFPFQICTLRFSFSHRFYQTNINDLQTQLIDRAIYIGLSRNFYTVRGKQSTSNHYRYVFE
ncbi:MAG: DUF3316 domain-containing protein [Dysgonamonadaceae bacterium]|jgi:hypothetical protein|nr:DUF3316 domain-containing protein [Dysgonamonadaceae bacterium]